MDWWQYVLYVSTTILATFVGGSGAFYWERRNKEKEDLQEKLASANRAIFILSRQFSILNGIRNQHINPARDNPAAWLLMRPILRREHSDLKYEINNLQFLFVSATSNILNELLLEEDRFHEAIKTLNERSRIYSAELQPQVEQLGLRPTDEVPLSVIEEKLSPNTVSSIKDLTKALIEHVDEGIEGLKNVYSKLYDAFVNLFPGKPLIEIKFPE
jgi:hypothetical protein